jgi:predicted nucleic acid-binding protein
VIVVDASALLEALLRTPVGIGVRQRLLSGREVLHAPHLIDLEIASVLRRYALARVLDVERCRQALIDLGGFRLYRHSHNHLLSRVWQLRHNLSTYDAVYVTLAEMLAAPLLTHDRRIAGSVGHRAQIELV